jgi:hypothetical protein
MAQAMQNVVKLATANKSTRQVRRTTRATRALRRQAATAIAVGAVAVVLTALSLNHLATGIEIITHASGWEAMALAVGVDLASSP